MRWSTVSLFLVLSAVCCACATGTPSSDDDDDDDDTTVDASMLPDGTVVDASPVIDAAPSIDAEENGTECAAAIAGLVYDWESGDQGWVHNLMPEVDPPPVSWTFDHWERGSPSSGPSSCNGGTGCWATNLDDNYVQCQRAYLLSPAMDLSACADTAIELVFSQAYDFWTGSWDAETWYDGGLVELSANGTTWVAADLSYPGTIRINPDQGASYACVESNSFYVHGKQGFVGANASWHQVAVPIPSGLRTAAFRVRFSYASGVSWQTTDESTSMQYTRPGWYIDDLRIE